MRSLSPAWLALAAIALSLTLHISDGFYHEGALAALGAVLLAALCGLTGLPWPWRGGAAADVMLAQPAGDGTAPAHERAVLATLLGVGVLASALALVTKPLARYMDDPRPWAHPALLVVVALMTLAAVVGSSGAGRRRRRVAAAALLAGGLWMGAWTIVRSPAPHIDVLPVHADAFAALARGVSPYGITFDDMYAGNEAFYVPEMRANGRVLFGFPYPPLSLLMAWPGHALLGDLRYSEVAALVLTAALLIWMRPDGVGLLCAAGLLLAPRLPFHIEQGWTEPFPIVLLAATVATALRRPDWVWLPLGLLAASKQHMVLGLLFAPWLVGTRDWRHLAGLYLRTAAVGLIVTLPFALLDADAFYRSAILLQLREPFRLDSLSFARLLAAEGWMLDKQGAVLLSLGAGAVAAALAWWRAARTPAGFAAALGVTCLLITAFGKKAFLNYYMLVVAALLTAIAAHGASRGRPAGPAREPRQDPPIAARSAL